MKTVNKTKEKKQKNIKKTKVKEKKEKVLLVAQEIKFARLLSSNEKKTRDRVLKTFKKWLNTCLAKGYEFKEDDFIRVWKGLFYAMWMSDKPLVQEDLCETIASILDEFPAEQVKYAILMVKAGFKVLATEWYGIDYHRIDKFLMLVRRYLRGSLRCVKKSNWSMATCRLYSGMLSGTDGLLSVKTPNYARNAGSMLLHVVDCFLEELAKVSCGELPEDSVAELLRPFCVYMSGGEAPSLVLACQNLLTDLMRQSDDGLEYQSRTKAWERMGCPRGGPDALQLASDDDEESTKAEDFEEDMPQAEKPLDPRAGRVDVELATIPVPATQIADILEGLRTAATSKAHKRLKLFRNRFLKLAKHEYPLRVPDVFGKDDDQPKVNTSDSAKKLQALERSLVGSADELALRGLSRKHRKRLLAKARTGLSIVEDVPSNTATNDNWEVTTEPTNKKRKQTDTSNKETEKKPYEKTTTVKSKKKKNKQKSLKVLPVKNATDKSTMNSKSDISIQIEKPKNTKEKPKPHDKHKKPKPNADTNIKTTTKTDKVNKTDSNVKSEVKKPSLVVSKVKNYQKKDVPQKKVSYDTPKKVKFVLKNNSMQRQVDYYKSVRQSPSIPFDSSKKPTKTNLKPSTPSPINPFFKKKLRIK